MMDDNESISEIIITNIIPVRNRLRDKYNETYFEVIHGNIENLNEVYLFFTSIPREGDNNIGADETWYFYIHGGEVNRVNENRTKHSDVIKVNFDTLVLEIRMLS